MPRKNSTDKPPVLSETQIVKAHSYTRKIKKFSFHKSEEIEIISKLTLVPYWNSKHELSTSYGKNHAQVLHIQLAPRKKYIDFLKSLHHRKIFKRQKKKTLQFTQQKTNTAQNNTGYFLPGTYLYLWEYSFIKQNALIFLSFQNWSLHLTMVTISPTSDKKEEERSISPK